MGDNGINLSKLLMAKLSDFYICPTTGKAVDSLRGDDKVLCNCGKSNPKAPWEETHKTGTHVVKFLEKSNVDQWVKDHPEFTSRRKS